VAIKIAHPCVVYKCAYNRNERWRVRNEIYYYRPVFCRRHLSTRSVVRTNYDDRVRFFCCRRFTPANLTRVDAVNSAIRAQAVVVRDVNTRATDRISVSAYGRPRALSVRYGQKYWTVAAPAGERAITLCRANTFGAAG